MAGRPKTMYRKVKGVADRMYALGEELFEVMPDQYKKRENTRDRIHSAWREAIADLLSGWRAVSSLCDPLAAKTGIATQPAEPVSLDDDVNPADPDQVADNDMIILDGIADTLVEWAICFDIPVEVIRQRVRDGADWELALTGPLSDDELGNAEPPGEEADCDIAPRK